MNKKHVRELIDKAIKSIDAAQLLLNSDHPDFAVSRAYYAMFYAAQAMLYTRDVIRSKHSGVISAFGELFVKNGIVEKEYYKMFREAFDERNLGDYDILRIDKHRAEEILSFAQKFIDKIKDYLANKIQ